MSKLVTLPGESKMQWKGLKSKRFGKGKKFTVVEDHIWNLAD